MANRRPPPGGNGGRRMDFQRMDQRKNFERSGVSPWQGGGPGAGLPNMLPLGGGSAEATLALASNILNLLQPRQNPVPSLLDMPIRRDFVPTMGRFDRCNFPPQRMVNHSNFRRTGNYNRAGERINNNRKQFKPNDGPRQQNKSPQKKEADSKAIPVKESETEEKKSTNETETGKEETKTAEGKKEPHKTRYDEVHTSLLKCHICNKSMWDGRSFENHLNGRAHSIMMQKAAESYALTADTMRQEFKIREMKRTRKSGQVIARDFYCAMCDMYAGDGGVHRTTVGHRKLKKYLHPTCTSCHKEMPTRIEMDEHRLTVDHLRNIHGKQEDINKPKHEAIVVATLAMEQSFLREDRQRKRRDNKDQRAQAAVSATAEGDETAEVTVKKEAEGVDTNGVKCLDTDRTVTDITDGLEVSTLTADQIPSYSTERGVGRSFLTEFKCVQCKLCNKLLDNEETAEVHLRTWKHHQLFVRALQPNPPPQQTQEAQKVEPSSALKRGHDSDDGNWKRRRTSSQRNAADSENGDIKEEKHDYREDGVKDEPLEVSADSEMPEQEELEDWEQSVDEILDDEKNNPESAAAEPDSKRI